jgi:MtN3 and saliva related transmembrane protein
MTDALAVLAAGWGVLMALSPILQIRRIFQRRSSADISIGYLLVLQIGFLLWMSYGIALRNLAIITPNTVAFLIGLLTLLVTLRFRRFRPAPPSVTRREGVSATGR